MVKFMYLLKNYFKLILFVYLAIIAVEIISIKIPKIGLIGTVLWIVSYFFLTVYTVKSLIYISKKIIAGKFLLSTFVVLTLCVIVFVNIASPRNLSHEATQEISCALKQFGQSTDA